MPQAQFPTGYEPRWLSRSAEVLRKPAGLSWHPSQVTSQLWKVLRLRQENSNKSCDWHMHFGKSSGLRHPSFFFISLIFIYHSHSTFLHNFSQPHFQRVILLLFFTSFTNGCNCF